MRGSDKARSRRARQRPNPADWRKDEPMMLEEAIDVFWPEGPLTVASLRTEIRKGQLKASRVAGRLFVTPEELWAMFTPEPASTAPAESGEGERRLNSGGGSPDRASEAQRAAEAALSKLRRRPRS